MADSNTPTDQQSSQDNRERAHAIATRICEGLYTAIIRRPPPSSAQPQSQNTVVDVDPLEALYFNGPNILPSLITGVTNIVRGAQIASDVGKTVFEKTLGGTKRRIVSLFRQQREEYDRIKNGFEEEETSGEQGETNRPYLKTETEIETSTKSPAVKENERVDLVDKRLHALQQKWREQPIVEGEQVPRALHAQRDSIRRIHKDRRRPLGELPQAPVRLPTAVEELDRRKASLRRAKELQRLKRVPGVSAQQAQAQAVQEAIATMEAERAKRAQEEVLRMMSAETKKLLEEGALLWKSPRQEEEEALARRLEERERRPRTLYPAPQPYLVPPIQIPKTIYVEPKEEEEAAAPEDQVRVVRRFGKTETHVPWWMKPEPLGPPISSTKMWKEWFKPPPAGPTLNPVNKKWRRRVERAMAAHDRDVVAKSLTGDQLRRHDLYTCFREREWLNDEVINAYLALIVDYAKKRRAKEDEDQNTTVGKPATTAATPKYHAFNSFFFSNLRDKGYDSVRRWANRAKIGGHALLSVDTVFVPVHNHMHWTLIIIRPQARTIENLDSLGGPSPHHIQCIHTWLAGELKDKYHANEWQLLPTTSAQQNNSSDCGVFLLTNAKVKMLGKDLEFGPKEIPEIRRRIVAELMHGSLDGNFEEEEGDSESDDSD
ncbi:Ulp1 protease family protein [Ascosphaera apis ARSEF 7405]|uniref:Ulp1 protease family protein n=1 Tax=Ascosphaera apis ARSEF 7405 TaxID=392613 RepID=A0A167YP04_9EURO|nr:Ulp1 protease family protein [Ascosphaera apis ARSEF 7405]